MNPSLWRRLLAELAGTGLLVAVIVGSGIAAQRLSPRDAGLELLESSTATALGLTVLILVFGPVSGGHFNPVVSLADWIVGRRARIGLRLPEAGGYLAAQLLGAIGGSVLANLMFEAPIAISGTRRATPGHLLGELVATAVLVVLIFALARTGRGALAAPAVGAYIGAAYWFTSSTAFANPAVTVGRVFTGTFAGIAPGSVIPFLLAQLLGAALGVLLLLALFPAVGASADGVVIPHPGTPARASVRPQASVIERRRS